MPMPFARRLAGRTFAALLVSGGVVATVGAQPSVSSSSAGNPVRGYVEGQSLTMDGELDTLIEDYADGRSRTRHFLKTSKGRVELKFDRNAPAVASGSRVRIKGRVQGDMLALDGADTGSVQVTAAAVSGTLGEQRTAVILVNFQDDTSQPITTAAATSLVFDTVSNHFRESSFDQNWLSGKTFGWYTVPLSKTACDTVKIASEADKAVQAAGNDLSGYSRKVYMFPNNASCGWTGLATVGGTATNAFINGAFTLQAVGHEMGHNYGLRHAHALDCDVAPLGQTCKQSSYGDAVDLMGNNRSGHFSPFAKEWLGWLNDGVSPPILTASASGRYVIEPYSSASVGPKAVKVPAGYDSTGKQRWYYIEYRQPVGTDAVLAGAGNLTQGVMVRLASEGDPDSIYQLDMHPGTSNVTLAEMSDGALSVGQSYTDAAASLVITLASASASGAALDVQLGGAQVPACVRAQPALSLAGPTVAVPAGTTISYTATLTNNDSSGCPATTFNLAGSTPSGWTGAMASTLAVSPGASASTTLAVTSPGNATAGSYGIAVGGSSSAGTVHTASASIAYSVAAASGVLSETVGTDKASYLRGQTVYMSARVLNSGVAVSGASVRFNIGQPGGAVTTVTATTGSDGYARSTYKIGKGKAAVGTYQLRADAASGSKTATSSTSFSAL